MKNNSDRKYRVKVYAVILAGMLLVSLALYGWFAFQTYRQYRIFSDPTMVDTSIMEEDCLNNILNEADRGSFGLYYMIKQDALDDPVSPVEFFTAHKDSRDASGNGENSGEGAQSADQFMGDGGSGSVEDGGDAYSSDGSGADFAVENFGNSGDTNFADTDFANNFNDMVKSGYNDFINILREYNLNYFVKESDGGGYLTDVSGMTASKLRKAIADAYFYMKIDIDGMGIMTPKEIDGHFKGNLASVSLDSYTMKDDLEDQLYSGYERTELSDYPKKMTIHLFSDSGKLYEDALSSQVRGNYDNIRRNAFISVIEAAVICGILLFLIFWALYRLPKLRLDGSIFTKMPMEVSLLLILGAVGWFSLLMAALPFSMVSVIGTSLLIDFGLGTIVTDGICVAGAAFGAQILLFAGTGGLYALSVKRPARYFREQTLTVRFCRFIKRKAVELYQAAGRMVFDAKNHRILFKVLLANFGIVSVLACLWFFGILGAVVYSIVIFAVGVRFLDRFKAQYDVVRQAAKDMAEGQLNTEIDADAGAFEPLREDLVRVREGVKIAVAEEVKSQKMKTELITNVSHDLKTPLTAIITYTDLLKDEDLSAEDRRKYIEILDQKADRLKRLIEDLFEVSKADSGNIKVVKTWLDLNDLVRQAAIENEDKLKGAGIDLRMSLPDGRMMLQLDSQKMYRIMDNLLGNVAKYSLAGTRAYISVEEKDAEVWLTVKNISAGELPDDVSTLTDRFVRGDKSRNTEGSGLGLAIVRSFAELMGGSLEIRVDGDLFKAILRFRLDRNMQRSGEIADAPSESGAPDALTDSGAPGDSDGRCTK